MAEVKSNPLDNTEEVSKTLGIKVVPPTPGVFEEYLGQTLNFHALLVLRSQNENELFHLGGNKIC